MRILHIDTGREMRGGQWQVLYLVESLMRRGHTVTLLARAHSPLLERADQLGIDVGAAHVNLVAMLGVETDIVHAHDARAHTLAALASRRALIVSRRVAFPVKGNMLSRWKYSRASRFIAVSDYVKTMLLAAGIAQEKITVVYDGVPLGPAPRFEIGSRIVSMQTDDPEKGMDLVKAAAGLAGVDVLFSRNLAYDFGGARAFVYITREEGLGSAVLLAMAAGVPVIASAVGGLPEIVQHMETGILVENTPDAIAAAMRTLLEAPVLAERIARAARRRVEERFSVDTMVQGTLEVYHRVLAC